MPLPVIKTTVFPDCGDVMVSLSVNKENKMKKDALTLQPMVSKNILHRNNIQVDSDSKYKTISHKQHRGRFREPWSLSGSRNLFVPSKSVSPVWE